MSEQLSSSFFKHLRERRESMDEEGFAEEEAESLIVPKQDILEHFTTSLTVQHKNKIKNREPRLKLIFVSKQKNSREELRRSIMQKEERTFIGKSLDLGKRDSRQSVHNDLLADCVTKIKRTVVGDNITIPSFSLTDSKAVKAHIYSLGATLIFEQVKQISTHGFLRSLTQTVTSSFIDSQHNQLIKTKLKQSLIMSKRIPRPTPRAIQFWSDYESANLQFAAQLNNQQYDLYLKTDTNTHGHQSWFNFRIKNNNQDPTNIIINICNMKRDLRLFQEGQKIFTRKVNNNGQPISQWTPDGNNFQFKVNNNAKFSNTRVFKLSFQLSLTHSIYEVALLPSYTYSDMIKQIQGIRGCQHVSIEILTYSLVGLAIPILTFTNKNSDCHQKQVTLISCRIHPGETNASFMARGLIRAMASGNLKIKQFLDKHIIKIIPMINPDGVIFGNFRTNFLGIDLNRAFDNQDQIINPQISALKELGSNLKEQFGDRFNMFLDLHGHSFDRNIFSYGPDYDSTQSNFYQIRLLPKILSNCSKYFKYSSCTFRLQEYKKSTARGYFLSCLGLSAYTIQSSYAVYVEEGKSVWLGLTQWVKFGEELAEGLTLFAKLSKLSNIRNRTEMKKALSQADKQQIEIIKKIKKQFKKQKEQEIVPKTQHKKSASGQDSDGQNQNEDYNRNQREQIVRRMIQSSAPTIILPRVLKPSIIYPTVTPKLFKIRQQFQITHSKILYTKRGNKYSGLRMHGNVYIHSLKDIQMMKPQTKNIFH